MNNTAPQISNVDERSTRVPTDGSGAVRRIPTDGSGAVRRTLSHGCGSVQ